MAAETRYRTCKVQLIHAHTIVLYSTRSVSSNNTAGACRFGTVSGWVSDFFSVCLSAACLLGAVDACLCDVNGFLSGVCCVGTCL